MSSFAIVFWNTGRHRRDGASICVRAVWDIADLARVYSSELEVVVFAIGVILIRPVVLSCNSLGTRSGQRSKLLISWFGREALAPYF